MFFGSQAQFVSPNIVYRTDEDFVLRFRAFPPPSHFSVQSFDRNRTGSIGAIRGQLRRGEIQTLPDERGPVLDDPEIAYQWNGVLDASAPIFRIEQTTEVWRTGPPHLNALSVNRGPTSGGTAGPDPGRAAAGPEGRSRRGPVTLGERAVRIARASLFCLVLAAAVPARAEKVADFFPVPADGRATWEYVLDGGAGRVAHVLQPDHPIARAKRGGFVVAWCAVEGRTNVHISTEVYKLGPDGLGLVSFAGVLHDPFIDAFDPPLLVLKEGFKVGTRWTWKGRVGLVDLTIAYEVEAQETIDVHAGKFDCFRVIERDESQGGTVRRCYAKGVGLVKEETVDKEGRSGKALLRHQRQATPTTSSARPGRHACTTASTPARRAPSRSAASRSTASCAATSRSTTRCSPAPPGDARCRPEAGRRARRRARRASRQASASAAAAGRPAPRHARPRPARRARRRRPAGWAVRDGGRVPRARRGRNCGLRAALVVRRSRRRDVMGRDLSVAVKVETTLAAPMEPRRHRPMAA